MKKTILLILFIMVMLLCGCTKKEELESKNYYIVFYTDPVTNVEYVIYDAPYRGGICPRYNPDGSLFVRGCGEE